jgi:hypothetical protein
MKTAPLLLVALALAACGAERASVEEIVTPAAPGSGEPSLALGPDGRVYLAWQEPADDSATALRWAVLEDGGWSDPRTIAAGADWFVNWADFPALAVLPGGGMAAHWLQKSGAGTYAYDVRVSVSADGGESWSAGATPHTDGTRTEHGFVSMWPVGRDSVGLVWLDGRNTGGGHDGHGGGPMTLRATVVGPDGGALPDVEVDPSVCDCCQTGAALTSAGPVVVYRGRTEEEVRDVYVTRLVDGAWTPGRPVHADGWTIPACPVNGPQVAAEGSRIAVAWYTAARDTARVHLAFSGDAGATFTPPVRVDGGNPLGRVDVVLLEGGDALVSWMERTGGERAAIQLRRVSPAGRAGEPLTVAESTGARSTGFPRMVAAPGGVVLAWTAAETPARVRTARITPGRR